MHKQPSDTDQSRAHPAAADGEVLKGPSRNKTSCSVTQIKTKSMLIINSSQGVMEKGKRYIGILSCMKKNQKETLFTVSLMCDFF